MQRHDLGLPGTAIGLERTAPRLTQRHYLGRAGAAALRSDLAPLLVAGLEVSALPGQALAFDLSTTSFEGLALSKGVLSGSRSVYTATVADPDGVLLIGAPRGRSLMHQAGRELMLGDGDAFFVDPNLPYAYLAQPMHACAIRLSRSALASLDVDVDARLMGVLQGHRPALEFLMRYADVVHDDGAVATEPMRRAVATHIHDLVALLVGIRGEARHLVQERGVRAARAAALNADIEAHLTDPALSPAASAGRLGISVRYVHRLLEDAGENYSAKVLAARVQLARKRLRDPKQSGATIASIAFALGFGDLSYFNRSFKRQVGCTPREWRHRDGPSGH